MIVLHFMFALLLLFAIGEQLLGVKILKPAIPIFVLLLIAMAAFRPAGMDRDSPVYFDFLNEIGTASNYFTDGTYFLTYEPTFYLIPILFKNLLGTEYFISGFFIFYAIIGVFFKIRGIIGLSKFYFLSFLIYFSNFFLLHELTQIRGGVAAGIFLFALTFLQKKQPLKYIFWILLACLFHYASIILFIVPFINKIPFSRLILLVVMGVTLLLAFFNNSLLEGLVDLNLGPFSQKVEVYQYLTENEIEGFGEINKLNLLFLLQLISTIIFIFYEPKITTQNVHAQLLIKCMVTGLFFFQLFNSLPAIAFRTSEMFLAVNIITFPFYIYLFKHRIIGIAVVIFIAVMLFYLNIYYAKIMNPVEYF